MSKAKREQYIVFGVFGTGDNEVVEAIGKDNEDLSRTMNNEVTNFTNVLGKTSVEVTKGAQTTTVDPFKQEGDSEMAKFLQKIYFENLDGSDVEMEFIEASMNMSAEEDGEYPAFKQTGAINLQSHGGDTTGISDPFDINWKGDRTYGTFNPTTKKFTAKTA